MTNQTLLAMPNPEQILANLSAITNNYSLYAIIWHIVFLAIIVALIAKWIPNNRLFVIILSFAFFSVSAFALLTGNPFNGTLFLLLGVLIMVFGVSVVVQPIRLSRFPFIIAGVLMVIFGLVYPHFIEASSVVKYLYSSPVGLIPCPTLSVVIGLALIFSGFGSQAIMLTLILYGLFYSLFGVIKLSVHLDVFLLLGTLVLLVKYIMSFLK